MIIAQNKREENIAEYLLYMWQLEDILRSINLDEEQARVLLANSFDVPAPKQEEIAQWYAGLIQMMREEGVAERGHLQMSKNVIIDLLDLHSRLLRSHKEAFYSASYYQTLPYIVELRSKQQEQVSDIETCFVALYFRLLSRLKGEKISDETNKALDAITRFVTLLAEKYSSERAGALEL